MCQMNQATFDTLVVDVQLQELYWLMGWYGVVGFDGMWESIRGMACQVGAGGYWDVRCIVGGG